MGTHTDDAGSGPDDLALIAADGALLVAAGRQGPPSAPVRACPDWDLAALCGHLGRIHRWSTQIVLTGDRPERGSVPPPPDDPAAAVDYLEAGIEPLLAALRDTDPERPAWNGWGVDQTAGFWRRRQSLETAVHRWDGQDAVGDPAPLDAALAVAGVDEVFAVWLARDLGREGGVPFAGSLHLHSTDRDGEWTVVGDGSGTVTVDRGHAKGDAAVRGPASALALLLWRRIEPEQPDLTTFGDRSVLDAWLGLAVP